MIEFHKQSDGTWKRFGEPAEEEPVTIAFHNARLDPPFGSFLRVSSVPPLNAAEPDKVRHSDTVEGEFTWAEAIRIVEDVIRDDKTDGSNLCRIRSAVYREVEDAFALAQRDLVAKHPEWTKSSVTVAPEFHQFSIDIFRADGQRILRRVGSLELCQLIKDRLSQKLGGRISDPSGNVIDEWK